MRAEYEFIDSAIQSNMTYQYRLLDVDSKGIVTVLDVIKITVKSEIPNETRLEPASPNPFNPQTKIMYQLNHSIKFDLRH